MNVTFVRLKSVVSELRGIRHELGRMADCWEQELASQGVYIKPPKADLSGPDPTMEYVEEDMDWAREQIEFIKREDRRQEEEELKG